MPIFPQLRPVLARFNGSPFWFRFSSVFLLLLGAALLLLSPLPGIDLPRYYRILIPVLLASIVSSVFVFGLYFRLIWRKQRASNRASYATVRKFASVFEHVLDGILILDDDGICLEANPAACDILRVAHHTLLGQPFAKYSTDTQEFARTWKATLERGCQRGHAELRRRNGLRGLCCRRELHARTARFCALQHNRTPFRRIFGPRKPGAVPRDCGPHSGNFLDDGCTDQGDSFRHAGV